MMSSIPQTWIGLVEVRPRAGIDVFESTFNQGNIGAFATVVVLALNEAQARSNVENKLDSLGLNLIEFSEIDLFSERMRQYSLEPDIIALAAKLDQQNPVGLDEFAVFPLDEER